MKIALLASLACAAFLASPCHGQEASDQAEGAMVEPFTGEIVFHQKDARVAYKVTITNGLVTGGVQHMLGSDEPIAKLVGGWYDHRKGQLSLLIQGTAEGMEQKWVAQIQQFRVDPRSGEITLEHMLHGYGLGIDDQGVETAHVIDSLDGLARLVGAAGPK